MTVHVWKFYMQNNYLKQINAGYRSTRKAQYNSYNISEK